jgi:hypothetical protein
MREQAARQDRDRMTKLVVRKNALPECFQDAQRATGANALPDQPDSGPHVRHTVGGGLARFVNIAGRMAESVQGWLVAAACCEERPAATFADLSPQLQDARVRVVFITGASLAYFITLAILARPIPSRAFVTTATLLAATSSRSPLLERRSFDAIDAASPRELPAPAAVRDPIADAARRAVSAPRPERRNGVSRFFRGVWRGVRAQPRKSDSL